MIEHLKGLRHNFKDEIPSRIVHSNDPDNLYKVRRNWFTGVVADVWNLVDEGQIINGPKKVAAEQLMERFTSEEFANRELTTAEDIAEANRLIDIILGS